MITKVKIMANVIALATSIEEASQKLAEFNLETPCYKSEALSQLTGAEVYLKCEHLQKTGSFKVRGAFNKLLSLNEEEKKNGVVAASSGNHGKAVAFGANILGIKADIFVPKTASKAKAQGIEMLGAEVHYIGDEYSEAEKAAKIHGENNNQTYISPYNDLMIMAGQGTIAHEVVQQVADIDAVFASVGGGGLIGGIGSYLKSKSPRTTVVGCWPANSPDLLHAIEKGKIEQIPPRETLSDGTAGHVEQDSVTFPICQNVIDEKVTVSEEEIKSAMRLMAEKEGFIIEGAAGVALAGFIKLQDKFKGKKVVIVLCGRNISFETYLKAVSY